MPPYLIAVLPDAAFSIVHQCLTLCYDVGDIPHSWLVSETLCIFKGKGSWRDPDRWRPIAMSNSVYRLLMRWIYKKLYPLLPPQLHPRQFGGRRGVSTAHATQTFFDDIDNGTSWESIFTFDMYHAFDSPPKILIRDVLQRMGTPTKLLLLISTVLEHGSTYIRGTPEPRRETGVPHFLLPFCHCFRNSSTLYTLPQYTFLRLCRRHLHPRCTYGWSQSRLHCPNWPQPDRVLTER